MRFLTGGIIDQHENREDKIEKIISQGSKSLLWVLTSLDRNDFNADPVDAAAKFGVRQVNRDV